MLDCFWEKSMSLPTNAQPLTVPDDRRRSARRRLRLRACIQGVDRCFTLEVLDISERGMLFRGTAALEVGDGIEIELNGPTERTISGKVVWAQGKSFGCYLERDLTTAEMARALLRARPLPTDDTPPPLADLRAFGERVRELRQRSPYTMKELAAIVQVSKPTLWKWETGKARPREVALQALARALETDAAHLLYGIDTASSHQSAKILGGTEVEQIAPFPDFIAHCRMAIARRARVDASKVTITIDWD